MTNPTAASVTSVDLAPVPVQTINPSESLIVQTDWEGEPGTPVRDNQQKIPLYAETGEENLNHEPSVPRSYPAENPITGISGHKVERFFKTLSTDPVYFHYAVHPGDESNSQSISEVVVALAKEKSYMSINNLSSSLVVLKITEDSYYQIDLLASTYEEMQGTTSFNESLSLYSFQQAEGNATSFIFTGSGNAVFMGKQVTFEEFTVDGEQYIRYYFIGDAIIGHRTFKDGHIIQTVEISEVSNRTVESLFNLPGGLRNVKTNETSPDPVTRGSAVVIPGEEAQRIPDASELPSIP